MLEAGKRDIASLKRVEQWYPRQDSNLRFRLRRPVPYPLGHWGAAGSIIEAAEAEVK